MTRLTEARTRRVFPLWRLVALLTTIVLFFLVGPGSDAALIWGCLACFYALFLRAVLRSDRPHPGLRSVLRADVLFLAFSFVLFFLPYQASVLGRLELSSSRWIAFTFVNETNHAILLSLAGMIAFSIGADWQFRRAASSAATQNDGGGGDRYRLFAILGPLLMAAFIALYQASGWRSIGEGRYSGTAAGGSLAEGSYTLIQVLAMATLAIAIARIYRREAVGLSLWLGVALSGYWALRVLVSGDRNTFLLIALVGAVGIATYIVRIRWWILTILVAVALALYNAVEISRLITGSGARDVFDVLFSESSAESGGELSFNITTIGVRAGLAGVPAAYPFGLGEYKILGLLGVLPFLRGQVISDSELPSTSKVLASLMLNPNATWGVGSNIVTDSYIDFGLVGVIGILFLLGLFVAYVTHAAVRFPQSTMSITIYLMVTALFSELPRYSVSFFYRPLLWAIALLLLARFLASAIRNPEPYRVRPTSAHRRRSPATRARRTPTTLTNTFSSGVNIE